MLLFYFEFVTTMIFLTCLLLLLLILLSVTGLICYNLYIGKKEANLLLKKKNIEILMQIKALEKGKTRLQLSSNKLKEINRNKDKFFSIISHDLRGPLNSLTGLLQILMKYAESFSKDELKEFGQNMDRSVSNLIELLDNLLKWSQSQSGMIEYRPKVITLSTLIHKTALLSEGTARDKNISLHLDIDPAIQVKGDADMISFIIRNLVSNAIKFTSRGGSVHITSSIMNDEAEIAVTDTGTGMSKEVLNKLFKIDSCHTSNGTENEIGTGLGLILCKEFIQKNSGKMEIESELNKGTAFRFRLPAIQQEVEAV